MKKKLLAVVLAITMVVSLLPVSLFAAVPENDRPRNPSTNLVIGILNDTRADGGGEFPNEPAVTGYSYYYLQSDMSLSTSYSDVYFSGQAGRYIDTDAFWDDDRIVENAAGNAFGYYTPEGLDLASDSFFVDSIKDNIDETAIIEAWMRAERITDGDAEDYELLFYVLKYETGWSAGYHLDAKVVRKDNVTLSYDANKPDGVAADVTLPSSNSVAKNTTLDVEDMSNASKTLVAGDMIYTFDGWNTAEDGSGDPYAAGDEITVAENTVLYAQWKIANTYTVTWRNYNEALLETDSNVPYGAKATYDDTEPTKPEDSHNTYTFIGWNTAKDGSGDSYAKDAEITVVEDIVLYAQYEANVIAHKATVEVVLNGTFDSEGNPDVPGTNVNIEDMVTGADGNLYLKLADGSSENYITLSKDEDGVYSNDDVPNGDYYIYIKIGDDYTQVGTQELTMANADRSRYLPYYSVSYDDGVDGETITVPDTEYYYIGSSVDVSSLVPEREGYNFQNWEDEDSDAYLPSTNLLITKLTQVITQPYTLTAVWEEAVTVNVTVVVDHNDRRSVVSEDLTIHLTAKDDAEDYNEVAGTAEVVESGDWYTSANTEDGVTTYVAEALYTQLPSGEYGAHALIAGYKYDVDRDGGYIVIDDQTANEYNVTLYLVYDPDGYELEFTVEIDPDTAERLIPEAVDVKVTRWNETDEIWETIPQHEHQSVEVVINKNTLSGIGKVHVWGFKANSDDPYLYRIEVVRVDLGDYQLTAKEVTADVEYSTIASGFFPLGAYAASVEVTLSGEHDVTMPELPGAHAVRVGTELDHHGELKAIVSANPYTVTLDPNGGEWSADDDELVTIENRFTVPALAGYVPTQAGYTFDGWYTKDASDNLTDEKFVGGEYINGYVTAVGGTLELYAKWKSNITVEGTVVVDLGYPCDDESREVTVALQMWKEGGTYDVTNFTTPVSLLPITGENYASGTYKFENVPDIGQYRVNVIVPGGGTITYMNEPDSTGANVDIYDSTAYDADSYTVVCGDDNTAVVNVYMAAELFDLGYQADVSAIGEDYRPTDLVLDLRHDHRDASGNPTYEVIKDDIEIADDSFTDGVSDIDTVKVPQYHANGYLYDYVISVLHYDLNSTLMGEDDNGWDDRHYFHYTNLDGYFPAPFAIRYDGPANYSETPNNDGLYQDVTLTAVFEPNKYKIHYELNNGTWPSAAEVGPNEHTWSFDTKISVTPVREGYVFMGWTANADDVFDASTNTIPANVWEEVTLTANWELDVWSDDPTDDDDDKGDGIPDKYQVRFIYYSENTEQGTVNPSFEIITLGDNVTSGIAEGSGSAAIAEDGYVFEKWETESAATFEKKGAETGKVTLANAVGGETYGFAASFAEDKLEDPTKDPDPSTPGDDIPDKYQVTVTYKIVNGYWDDSKDQDDKDVVFTLYTKNDEDGTWNPVSPAPMLGTTIPTGMIPDDAHTGVGTWDTEITATTTVDSDVTYTYTFGTAIAPSVDVEKTVNKSSALVGDTVVYSITVTNNGNVDLGYLTVTEDFGGDISKAVVNLPDGVEELEAGVYRIASLAMGSTVTIELSYVVTDTDAAAGALSNSVKVESDDKYDLTPDDPNDEDQPITDEDETEDLSVVYTVSYELNGGTGAAGINYATETVAAGTEVTVKAAPTREGYTFTGWSDGTIIYQPSDKITVNRNITLTAQWEEDRPIVPVIPVINKGDAALIKVDADDHNTTLSGVTFNLYRSDDTLVGTYVTDAAGMIEVTDLRRGDYYWVETHSAEGYVLDATHHEFTVYANETTSVTVENTRSKVPSVFSGDHFAYIIGYDDGEVKPEAKITRAEVATIFFRLLNDETREAYLTKSNSFADVNEGMWFNTAVSTMAAMGIVNGYPDGNFKPNEYITRAEFAAIAARFDENGNTTGESFDDLYEHWAKKEIDIAANNGWVLGYEDGTFKPDQDITRAEAMALVNRVLQRIPENEGDLLHGMIVWPDNADKTKWYYLTIQEATNSHDYERKASGYEYWVKLKETPDWTALEQ